MAQITQTSSQLAYGHNAGHPGRRLTVERNSARLWRLHTKTLVEEGNAVLYVEGRLGHAASAELDALLRQHVQAAPANVIIDLSGVDYLSGAALRVVEALAVRLSDEGRRLRLRNPSVAARLALELSGLPALVE